MSWSEHRDRDFIPAEPVRAFILGLEMTTGELAAFMESRSLRSQATWCRRLNRIFHDEYVNITMVDEIMVALGRHLSEVDGSYYREAVLSP